MPHEPDEVEDRLARARAGHLARTLNATGVVLHHNLGRAPLSAAARQAVLEAAGYTSLEFDLATGRREPRHAHLGDLLAELCGTEAATVVNNGAAALVLTLAALAGQGEVLISRGELVEIGGSYRLPDVAAASGARIVEVGTTNRTRLGDYRHALTDDTRVLLKVHRASFEVVGSTEEVPLPALADLGRSEGVAVVHHLGSGLLQPGDGPLADEPSVAGSVRAGADLVLFSGDKLLGGPQAGIIAGRSDLLLRCTRHPLARALQVDKLTRAALEATLESHLRDPVPLDVPTVAMLHADVEQLADRARWMAAELGEGAEPIRTQALVGGGASPGRTLPSWGVALAVTDAEELARRLRWGDPALLAKVEPGRLVLDLRALPPTLDPEVVDLVLGALG